MLPRHNLAKVALGIRFNARLECANGESKLGLEGIVSRRKDLLTVRAGHPTGSR